MKLRSLLLIEGHSQHSYPAVYPLLPLLNEYQVHQVHWDAVEPRQLQNGNPDLFVFVAAPMVTEAQTFFRSLRSHSRPCPSFAILPAELDPEELQTATERVDDFLLWPASAQEAGCRLRRILEKTRGDSKFEGLSLPVRSGLSHITGSDAAFAEVLEKVPVVSVSDAPVLISGETGTGKELCARAIHGLSARRAKPFVPVDCGAIPESLIENELFGHVRGAYTSANTSQRGLIAIADGGTLLLDEVDSLPLAAQAKLLRFLQDRSYRPLGSERFWHADVRVIAATNRNLDTLLQEKRFREDLYYRLNVLHLHLPPLRERRGDIILLARHFLETMPAPPGATRKFLAPATARKMEGHDWPGNVRELFNVLQRAVVFSKTQEILPGDVTLGRVLEDSGLRGSFRQGRARVIGQFEKAYIEELLQKHGGNVTRAAAEAVKERRAFGRLMKKYAVDRQRFSYPGQP